MYTSIVCVVWHVFVWETKDVVVKHNNAHFLWDKQKNPQKSKKGK